MELGITIPLQKHLNIRNLEYGTEQKLFYCWEVHRIRLQAEDTLVAVNASNRAAVVHNRCRQPGKPQYRGAFIPVSPDLFLRQPAAQQAFFMLRIQRQ